MGPTDSNRTCDMQYRPLNGCLVPHSALGTGALLHLLSSAVGPPVPDPDATISLVDTTCAPISLVDALIVPTCALHFDALYVVLVGPISPVPFDTIHIRFPAVLRRLRYSSTFYVLQELWDLSFPPPTRPSLGDP